jgi:hypothetical protein
MFSATLVAIMLMFVGDVIYNFSGSASSIAQQPTYPISFEQARGIALDTAPRAAIIGAPTLTSYEGAVAYAVPLDAGTIYVEATTGRVLANLASEAMDRRSKPTD